jgi:hypothetical protein
LREFSDKYIALYETVTGQAFDYAEDDEPIGERVRKNLVRALPEFFT